MPNDEQNTNEEPTYSSIQFKNILSETEMYPASALYNKSEIEAKLTSAIHYKGSVNSYQDLVQIAATGNPQNGDLYNVIGTGTMQQGHNYIWNSTLEDWDDTMGIVDLSNYYTKAEITGTYATIESLVEKQDTITAYGILKGTINGVVAATPGTDYLMPSALNSYVPTSTTVNDRSLTGNIMLDGTDLLVGGAGNYSSQTIQYAVDDLYASVSGAVQSVKISGQSTELKDSSNNVTIPLATSASNGYGVVVLSDSITGSSHDKAATEYAVSSALASAKAYVDSFDTGVTSVNGQTGTVILDASDVSAIPMSGALNVGGLSFKTNATITLSGGYVRAIANDGYDYGYASYYGDKITLRNPSSSGSEYNLYFPSYETVGASGTLAVQSSTLSGYGITDAKIENGTITLGSNSITPVTSVSDKVDKSTLTAYLTSTVTSAFPTTGYKLSELVAHYNILLGALRNIVTAITPTP